ncbi:rho-related GTP-binding protein RhoN-like [Cimex lectularius]|uniref:Uncharacterized protein n=1 Tax=Cimex lectularius TaxID=79782 RepID=A0A8I6RLE9_CIMLE|nr:rho-related GTP-binding protein RhoN-like [Cimex lectularius]
MNAVSFFKVACGQCYIVMKFQRSVAYDSVRPLAYQDAQVFLLCFCVADPDSLDNAVNKWYPEIREHCANTAVILCGCQVDLRSDKLTVSELSLVFKSPVTPEQGVNVSRQVGATTYVETSSKNSSKTACDAFEIAALAALGRLNMNTCLVSPPHKGGPGPARSKSKVDLKAELRYRAKSCTVM